MSHEYHPRTQAVRALVPQPAGDPGAAAARDLLGALWDYLRAKRTAVAFCGGGGPDVATDSATLDDLGLVFRWVGANPRAHLNPVLARLDPANGLVDASPASFEALKGVAQLDDPALVACLTRAATALDGHLRRVPAASEARVVARDPIAAVGTADRDHVIACLAWDLVPGIDGRPDAVKANCYARALIECGIHAAARSGSPTPTAAGFLRAEAAAATAAGALTLAEETEGGAGRLAELSVMVRSVAEHATDPMRDVLAREVLRAMRPEVEPILRAA